MRRSNRRFSPALKWVRFHDPRHTNVSICIDEGQSIVYISRQIVHESAKTTLDVYGHLMKDTNPEQAQKLDCTLGFVK